MKLLFEINKKTCCKADFKFVDGQVPEQVPLISLFKITVVSWSAPAAAVITAIVPVVASSGSLCSAALSKIFAIATSVTSPVIFAVTTCIGAVFNEWPVVEFQLAVSYGV